MSLEQFLLFAFLIAFALLERLIRALRARTSPPPARPPLPRPAGDAGGKAGGKEERHPRAAGARVGRDRQRPPAAAAPVAHLPQPARRGIAVQRLGARADLRRAIVLMAILGPCRALQHSSDASDRP